MNRNSFNSSFPVWNIYFFFLSNLFSLNFQCWIVVVKVGILASHLIFEESVQSFTIEYDISCRVFFLMSFIMLSKLFFSPISWDFFLLLKSNGFCQMFFLHQLRSSFFFLHSIKMTYYIDFLLLNHVYFPGIITFGFNLQCSNE